MTYEIQEVGRQFMYCYYHDPGSIPMPLLNRIKQYVKKKKLFVDESYRGFGKGGFDPFDPDYDNGELFDIFEMDSDFKLEAILFYQVRQVFKIGSIKTGDGLIGLVIGWKEEADIFVENFELKFGSDALVGVKIDLIRQARDNKIDRDLFRAYAAVKSILGKKKYIASNKPAILSRMVGCKTKEAFQYYTASKATNHKPLLATVKKYSKRYQMGKLLLMLAEKKFLMFLSKKQHRTIYLSAYMEPEELSRIVSESKSLKQRMKDAASRL